MYQYTFEGVRRHNEQEIPFTGRFDVHGRSVSYADLSGVHTEGGEEYQIVGRQNIDHIEGDAWFTYTLRPTSPNGQTRTLAFFHSYGPSKGQWIQGDEPTGDRQRWKDDAEDIGATFDITLSLVRDEEPAEVSK